MIYGDYDIGRKSLSHFIGYPKFNGNKSVKTRSKTSNHKVTQYLKYNIILNVYLFSILVIIQSF